MRRLWAGTERVAFTGDGQLFGMGKVSIASRGTWPSAAVNFWSVEGCANRLGERRIVGRGVLCGHGR